MANADRGAEVLDMAIAKKKAERPRFPRVWLDDAQADIDADYLIKGLIERGRLIVIFGPSGDGKTFFILDMTGHIAAGTAWRGRRVHRGLVVYVAAEAGASILRRFLAWRDHHLSEAREGRSPLAIVTRAANLLNMVEVVELIDELRVIVQEAGLPLALVVFDTLSRSIAGGDENSAEDMTRAIAAADAIRDELGAAVAFIHHSGKDSTKGARGHSSLFAAADTVIEVIDRVATVDKARDGREGDAFPFALNVVELGTDADGDAVTTCIVVPTDTAPDGPAKAVKLTPDEQVALDALREELSATGETLPETSVIPKGARAVRVEAWRNRFHARIGDNRELEQTAKRQAWHRGRKGLLAKHLVGCWEDFAWLAKA